MINEYFVENKVKWFKKIILRYKTPDTQEDVWDTAAKFQKAFDRALHNWTEVVGYLGNAYSILEYPYKEYSIEDCKYSSTERCAFLKEMEKIRAVEEKTIIVLKERLWDAKTNRGENNMPKLQLQNGRYSITIPSELVKIKAWKKEDLLMLMFNTSGNIEIRKANKKEK